MDFWTRMARRGPATVTVGGAVLGPGSRVRLRPRAKGDVLDLALAGRIAVIEGIEQDEAGTLHVAVTLEDDPGRDLGDARLPGHRFFYAAEELEPVGPAQAAPAARVLVAGIGNIFLGDDGFGVEVVRRLVRQGPIPGADVVDFGIRGMDLAYALQRDYHAAIFVDAAPRGRPPGTLTVLEPDPAEDDDGSPVETHGMDPVRVLRLARRLGRVPPRLLVVCCEPATVGAGGSGEDLLVELSEPVAAAVGSAAELVRSLAGQLIDEASGPAARDGDPPNQIRHEPGRGSTA